MLEVDWKGEQDWLTSCRRDRAFVEPCSGRRVSSEDRRTAISLGDVYGNRHALLSHILCISRTRGGLLDERSQ